MRLPSHLKDSNVAVIGLGLMGGGLALSLMNKCKSIIGIDCNEEVSAQAAKIAAFTKVSSDIKEVLPEADIIILSAPVQAIISIIQELPAIHPGPAMVMDLGSTKNEIIHEMDALPECFDPIGAHPMCGKEKSSFMYADPYIYHDAPFALVPLARTTKRAQQLALEIVKTLGSYPVWLDSRTHDRWTAATSHVPYLLANALAACTPDDSLPMVGSGFRSTSRLAPSDIKMMMDILQTNRENVIQALNNLDEVLQKMRTGLQENDFDGLKDLLQKGAENYHRLVNDNQAGEKECN